VPEAMKPFTEPRSRADVLSTDNAHTGGRIGELSLQSSFDDGFSLVEIFAVVRRRIWRIVFITIFSMILAGAAVTQVQPRFTAEALVRIENTGINIVDLGTVVSGLPTEPEAVEGEIAVIKSRELAEKVVSKLQLHEKPEFNASLRPVPEWRTSLTRALGRLFAPEPNVEAPSEHIADRVPDWRKSLTRVLDRLFAPEPNVEAPSEHIADRVPEVGISLESDSTDAEARQNYHLGEDWAEWVSVISAFSSALKLTRVDPSRVISVAFTSLDPVTAADVANAVADAYIMGQIESKVEITQRVTALLRERLESVRQRVDTSERAVESFRREFDLVDSGGLDLTLQQLLDTNQQIVQARADRAEAETRLQQVRKQLAASGAPLIPSGDQPLGDTLRSAESGRQLLHGRPQQAPEPGYFQLRTKTELSRLVSDMEHEAAIARGRETALEHNLTALKDSVSKAKDYQVSLRALEREAEANRVLFETLLARVKETSFQEDLDLHQADAVVLSRAAVPVRPSFPKPLLIVVLVGLCTGLLVTTGVFITDFNEPGFRSGEEIARTLDVMSVGLIPAVGRFRKTISPRKCADHVVTRPKSTFGSAMSALHWSLRLQGSDGRIPRKILIASTQPKEGKSTIALSLGRVQALEDYKVIVIDADIRHPRLHKVIGIPREPGLSELLTGNATLQETIACDSATNMQLIPAGADTPYSSKLLASDEMDRVLKALLGIYDCVIVDSPPIRAGMDASILARKVDLSLLVVRWRKTHRSAVAQAIQQIVVSRRARPVAVLCGVDVKRHAAYRFGDSGYYSGELKGYYRG